MLSYFKKNIKKIFYNLKGRGRLTEKNISDTIEKIKYSLLESDVSLKFINDFITNIKAKNIGKKISLDIQPGEMFIKIIRDELIRLVNFKKNHGINNINKINKKKLLVISLIGIQGSGKTTSVVKLAKYIKKNYKYKVLVSTLDIYRAAAIKQVKDFAEKHNIQFYFPEHYENNIVNIANDIYSYAQNNKYHVLIIDTGGILQNNSYILNKLSNIYNNLHIQESLFVLDSSMGQESYNIVLEFSKQIMITGFFLTKFDIEEKSGAILSASWITKKPIKFVGNGEKIQDITFFNAKKIINNILDMEDSIFSFKEIIKKIDNKSTSNLLKKINTKEDINFYDYLEQIKKMEKANKYKNIINKLPILKKYSNFIDYNNVKYMKSIILSMTDYERKNPIIIKNSLSRKKRIAKGSGNDIIKVNKLVKSFFQFTKISKKFKNINSMNNIIERMKNMG